MIEIYTSRHCPYCRAAKQLFSARQLSFKEIDIAANGERLEEMVTRSGGDATVPQIFIDGRHIGGVRALRALDAEGRLAPLSA